MKHISDALNAERHLLPPKPCGHNSRALLWDRNGGTWKVLCHHLNEDEYGAYCDKDMLFVGEVD